MQTNSTELAENPAAAEEAVDDWGAAMAEQEAADGAADDWGAAMAEQENSTVIDQSSLQTKVESTQVFTELSGKGKSVDTQNDIEFIHQQLDEDCTQTLSELQNKLLTKRNVIVSLGPIHNARRIGGAQTDR